MSEKKKKSGFSLTVIVIFMAVAAIFVGYLLGSWLIQFLNEDNAPQMTQEQPEEITSTESSIPTTGEAETDTEIKEPKTDSQTESVKDETSADETSASDSKNEAEPAADVSEKQNNAESEVIVERGDFGIQVGAFANYENAEQYKKEIESRGYKVVITDTDPHKVQIVGYTSREEAENAEKEIESAGYNGFIVSF